MGAPKLGQDYFDALNNTQNNDITSNDNIIDITKLYTFSNDYLVHEVNLEKKIDDDKQIFVPAPVYQLFDYQQIDNSKKPIFLREYLMGMAWGMVSLYNKQPIVAERLKGNKILRERVAIHEGYRGQGHLTFGQDEILTRIHTNTLDTAPFVVNDKYGV